MGSLETLVPPILLPIMKGDQISLTAEMQAILARWIAMKALVSEHSSPPDHVTPRQTREHFKNTGEIPAQYRIWITLHNCPAWRATAFYRQSWTFSHSPMMNRPVDGPVKNAQTLGFSIGKLFIFIMSTELPGFDMEKAIVLSPKVPRLWPPRDSVIKWPPARVLRPNEPGAMVTAMDTLAKKTGVQWSDFTG
jgi:hypothetical protein